MASALVCDKCGKVLTEFGKMRHVEISPCISVAVYNGSMTVSIDLCEDCANPLLDLKKKKKEKYAE